MTTIVHYICDTCGEQHPSQLYVFNCEECHIEICEDCHSPLESLCWDCYQKAEERSI